VPNEIKNACAELALKANDEALAPDIERIAKREKVGVLEVEYDINSPAYVIYRAIDNIVAPFLSSLTGNVKRVTRT
jgi:hypothetical protein